MYLFSDIRAQKAFLRDKSGALAPIFAVSISFLVLVSALGLEFGRWAVAQNELQANIDAAVLAGAEKLQSNRADTAGAVAAAKAVFDANKANQRFAGDITDTISFKVVGSSVISEGTASISSALAKVAGVTSFPLLDDAAQGAGRSASNAQATISNNKFEIALMLDITGSMCDDPQPTNLTDAACKTGTKITALKNAAKGLVNTVLATTDLQSRVKVSIVPFSDGVRPPSALLTTLRGVTLVPLPYSYTENRQVKTIWYHPTDCVAERGGDNAYTDAAPGLLAPQNYFMTAMRQGTSLTNAAPKEFGCMSGTASEVVPLSNNKDVLNNKIDALEAKGGTAGHLGTAWAWYTLSPQWKDVWPGTDSDPAPYRVAHQP